jgi:glycosyltransferase involved in cell wall biosynthesis
MAGCNRWLTGCGKCPLRKESSWLFDKSAKNYERKKSALSNLDLTIVTPSQWLADLVKQSFLKDYPVQVINNGIDLTVFKPSESDFRKRYGLEDKKILLGVAMGWGERKGLDVFIELHKRLPEEYKIVLVGTNDSDDKNLPDGIISIYRTQNQRELAEIYSAADVFVNPTREEVFGLVNTESLACGTPGVTFNSGGSPECYDETCGAVVECDDVDALEREILRICREKPYISDACIKKAKDFDKTERFKEYIELYERVNSAGT